MTTATVDLVERISSHGDAPAIAFGDTQTSYRELTASIWAAHERLVGQGITPGSVVAFSGDFGPATIAMQFGLALARAVLVPMGTTAPNEVEQRLGLGNVEWLLDDDGTATRIDRSEQPSRHRLLDELTATGNPGLILYSSGTSGPPKAALHDLDALFEKFATPRPALRTAGFLLFDHIGGLNTLWHVLSNGGLFACLPHRTGEAVAATIEKYALELLPTSPTFINLLIVSGAVERHDLSSLRVVTYGTEPMPETTLRRLHALLPDVELRQTYGLSELGILRAKSESSDSLWVRLGGEGYETRVDDGILKIRARSAMKGYLNAAAPFDADGWFNTGDQVEVKGDYFRILGRLSEIINVGGQKLHPSEVESAILELPQVAEVAVNGEPNPLLGSVVVAHAVPAGPIDPAELRSLIRQHCRSRLAAYKVPAKIMIVDQPLHSERFKKKLDRMP